jgi:Domain of unknown function (DUF4340)
VRARPAIVFTILAVILLPYYRLVDRPKVREVSLKRERASLLDLSRIGAITITRGSETLRFEKTADGKRFTVVTPPTGFIPQDLMNATASLFLQARDVEVVSDNSNNLGEFGLDNPKTEVTIEAPGRKEPVRILFGGENPTHTAVYAKVVGSPKVYLLGRNIEYYQDLMFQWIEGKQGKNA